MAYKGGPARIAGMGLYDGTAIGLCSIDDGSGDSGGGGGASTGLDGAAAALAAGDQGSGAGAGGGDGAGAGDSGGGGDGGGSGAADADWLTSFSADGGDADNPSNRDWLKAKGFKSLDDVAKSYREAEKAIHSKGVQVPGENATPEQIAAFNKAIGVPEKADGYAITLPDGVTEEQLDMPLLNGLKERALKAGTPAKAFDDLVQGVIQDQLDTLEKMRTAENGSRDDLFKEWGGGKDAKMADVQNAMRALGLKHTDVAAIQRGFAMQYGEPGSKRTLELLQKLGAGLAEDTLLGGGGPRRFGITGEAAQAEITKLTDDKEFGKKLVNKDPDAVARWNRLNEAVAADRERKERAQAA